MRIYHPDYRISFWDRVLDPVGARGPPSPPAGVDLTLLNRTAARAVRGFLDDTLNVCLLGEEMVRIDSSWRLPAPGPGQREVCAALARRLRFLQALPGGQKVPVALRWLDFQDAPHGTRLLVRLLDRPNPGLRSYVAGDVSEDGTGGWTEYAIGAD